MGVLQPLGVVMMLSKGIIGQDYLGADRVKG